MIGMRTMSAKNKKSLAIFSIAVFVIGIVLFVVNRNASPLSYPNSSTHAIELRPEGFYPAEITIRKGDTVTFKTTKGSYFWPASNLHPTHAIYSEFDPKEPVAPEEAWSFRFEKTGIWKYHDHLAPYFTGVINVIEGDNPPEPQASCTEDAKSVDCFQDKIIAVLEKDGVDAALDALAKLYSEEPEVAQVCHYITHNIGLNAYKIYLKNKDSILTPKAAYCANGFYHGFMEAFLTASGDVDKAKNFCTYIGEKLNALAPDAEMQCYHGIGHGAIEASLAKLAPARNEEEMIKPAIEMCETAADTDEKLYRCVSGIFNAIANFYTTGEFGLKANEESPLWLCDIQPEKYQEACYGNMNTVLVWLAKQDFQKAVGYIEYLSDEEAASAVRYLANMYTLRLAREDHGRAVTQCRLLRENLRIPCIEGFTHGFLESGVPGEEYKEALGFCRDEVLNSEERDICFKYALNLGGWYSSEKSEEICETIEPEYQKYCANQ